MADDQARYAHLRRTTRETDVTLSLSLDGKGQVRASTGVPFLDHMLEAFGRHGRFDLAVEAVGDLEVDAHHSVEDVGIVLGRVFSQALGERRGIRRFGSVALPMDEALVLVAVDLSGRGQLHYAMDLPWGYVGCFDTSLAKEFFAAFASNCGATLHIRSLAGENAHHLIEAAFKGVGRALSEATSFDERMIDQLPSTKGRLSELG